LDPVLSLSNLDLSFSFAASVTVNIVPPSGARPCPPSERVLCNHGRETTQSIPFTQTGYEDASPGFSLLFVFPKKIAGIEVHADDLMFEAIRCEMPAPRRNKFGIFYGTYRITPFQGISQFLFYSRTEYSKTGVHFRYLSVPVALACTRFLTSF
jgi:hypothetical protein